MAARKSSRQKRKPTAETSERDSNAPAIPQTPAGRKVAFLIEYEGRGSLTAAAKAAGIVRRTHYDWLEKDPQYAKSFESAKGRALDSLETEAWDRAFEGSDLLLIFLLKANNPAKYRDHWEPKVKDGDGSADDVLRKMAAARGLTDGGTT